MELRRCWSCNKPLVRRDGLWAACRRCLELNRRELRGDREAQLARRRRRLVLSVERYGVSVEDACRAVELSIPFS